MTRAKQRKSFRHFLQNFGGPRPALGPWANTAVLGLRPLPTAGKEAVSFFQLGHFEGSLQAEKWLIKEEGPLYLPARCHAREGSFS